MKLTKMIGRAEGFVKKNLPTILTFFSATTSIGAVFMSAKAEKRALERIAEAGTVEEIDPEEGQIYEAIWIPPTKKECFWIYVDEFMPVLLVEAMSLAGGFASLHENNNRIMNLGSALAISEARNKVLESKLSDDEKKEIAQEGVDEKLKEIGDLPAGSYLFKDPHYNMFIISTEKEFLRAVNAADSIFREEGFVTLGTFYYYWDKAAPNASMVEGWSEDQIINDWGELKIPITCEPCGTKAGAKYYEISYNSEIKPVLTDAEDILNYYD